MDKVEFKGDNPSARFGHTITPIGKEKAILFGGAVGDTGTISLIKASTSSLATPFFATTPSSNGRNLTTMACLPPTGQLTTPSP